MATTDDIAELLRRMDPPDLTPEGKMRIAEGVAARAIARGLWTSADAEQFLESVREKVVVSELHDKIGECEKRIEEDMDERSRSEGSESQDVGN